MPTLTQTVRPDVQRRILLIEDDPDISTAVTRWLTDRGMDVVLAKEAGQVKALCDSDEWDLVLSDIELPDFSGLDLVQACKTKFPLRPLVLMTSHERTEYAIRAIRGGVDDYLLKPLQREPFLRAIEAQIDRNEARRKTVLAIGAHPDDVEIGVGGLLLKHREHGDRVHILTLTGGEQGGIVDRRHQEAEESARLLDASLCFGDLPDTAVTEGNDTISLIRSYIDQVRPNIIYTHSVNDAHQDHRAVYRATMVAGRAIGNISSYLSPSTTIDFRPNQFTAIDQYLERKLAAIECYKSQTQKAPYLSRELITATARYWGRFAGYCHVEPLEVIREAR